MKTITALALVALLLLVPAPSIKDAWRARDLPAAAETPATWWGLF